MTDYGRGSGSEPWHPEDPLFGDVYEQGYQGQGYPPQGYEQQSQQPQNQQQPGDWQDPYATGQPQQYPQQGQGGYGYPQQGQPQHQQYPQQQPQQPQGHHPQNHQQYPQAGYDGYDTGSYDTGSYDTGNYATGGYAPQDPYGGQQPHDPYGSQQDFYGQNGYPPPQQPQYRQQPQPQQPQPHAPQQAMPQQGMPGPGQGQGYGQGEAQGQGQGYGQGHGPGQGPVGGGPVGGGRPQEPAARPLRTAPEETGDWDADADSDPREHAFFASGDDEDADEDEAPAAGGGRRGAKSQPKGGKKRRSGCACLVVAVVLAGGLGGAAYFGYNFYEDHFGPAPDYSGQGTADVQVQVPTGASLNTIGNILKKAGVVKSVDAFAAAAQKNPKGRTIQAGVYVLKSQMSAASAVTLMLDPKSQSALIFAEGLRASSVYKAIDVRLGLKAGTTAAQVKGVNVGLPAWAKGNPEGFLFPAKYSVAKGMKPVDVVKGMVTRATSEFTRIGLEDAARKAGKTPLQMLTIASLVQAEAQEDEDFGKVSRVVYNRLDHDMALGFDSTINYAMGRSTVDTTVKDTHYKSPYNTYDNKGLPPGPIDSPGEQAINAAINPTPGTWLYFVTVKKGDTRFATTSAEHDKNVADFNKYQQDHRG